MKRLLAVSQGGLPSERVGRTALLLLCVLTLAAAVWGSAVPVALGRDLAPAEMILDGLPFAKTMKSAAKSELLSAICGAVGKHRSAAKAITSVATAARREYAGDIVGTVLRCSGKIDCEFVGSIVTAAISAGGSAATTISDAAIARAPDCAETIQAATRRAEKRDSNRAEPGSPSPTEGPVIGTSGGADESFDPHEQLSLVCEGGTQRAVRESQLDEFLRSHPGSFVGSCPPTPTPAPAAKK